MFLLAEQVEIECEVPQAQWLTLPEAERHQLVRQAFDLEEEAQGAPP